MDEEELRKHFSDCGKIKNVRIIRDNHTLIGKGFGYIMFGEKEEMKKAITEKHGSTFKVLFLSKRLFIFLGSRIES